MSKPFIRRSSNGFIRKPTGKVTRYDFLSNKPSIGVYGAKTFGARHCLRNYAKPLGLGLLLKCRKSMDSEKLSKENKNLQY